MQPFPMSNLIVFCGIPGSGKTTLSNEIAATYDMHRISMDERNYIEHSEMIEPILGCLFSEGNVVVDAVYHKKKQREQLIQSVNDIECKKILIYMTTPLDECVTRNRERPNPLPDFVVESISKTFQPPTLDEGWDEIITI